jgi:F420-dependent oxidoreductase-like protein
MHFGLQLPAFDFPGGPASIAPTLSTIAQFVDDHGFHSLWVMDHFFQMEMLGGPDLAMLESYSTLAYLAAQTRHVRLGALVTGVIYRHPGILLKTVTTLDVLSGGRAYFGIGAGWYEREARGLGIPYPATSDRFVQLEETLQMARQAWSGDRSAFHGKQFHAEELLINPQPIQRPHPPIMIGGSGEKKTLRLVAMYADACNLFIGMGAAALCEKLDILRAHCDDVGRDYASIEKTALGTFRQGTSTADFLRELRTVADVGITHVIFNTPGVEDMKALQQFATEVIPEIAAW